MLAAAAFAGAAALGPGSLLLLALFAGLQLAYSTALKHVVLLDVLTIAALFVVRAAAGAEAIDVRISVWLFVCTGLLALFLALNKRRGEILNAQLEKGRCMIHAYVPLAEMFGYTSDLRSATSGTAAFSMEPSHYAPVKEELADLRLPNERVAS